MGFIELSDKFLQKVKDSFNSILKSQDKEIKITEDSKELPSPKARVSYNLLFMRDFEKLLKKYYPDAYITGVTDTNSMEPVIDISHRAVIIPFKEEEKKEIVEGDIILFDRIFDSTPNVMHRVIEKRDDGIVITKGDNLVRHDGFTLPRNIKGYCAIIFY